MEGETERKLPLSLSTGRKPPDYEEIPKIRYLHFFVCVCVYVGVCVCGCSEQSNPWLKEKGTQLFPHNKHLRVFAMQHDCSVEMCVCTSQKRCVCVCVYACVQDCVCMCTSQVQCEHGRLEVSLVLMAVSQSTLFCEVATRTTVSTANSLVWV